MVSTKYRRRRPEDTLLYRTVRDHLSTFLEVASRRSGMKSLPTYVRQEFDRYLDCGILANGFARVRCPGCGHDEVVAFSCKGRGFCPSCMGRRMADTAAHLVDHVFPRVPIRQWVLSFPYGVRLHFARDAGLLSRAITVFMEEVTRHYERELVYAKEGLDPEVWRGRRALPFREEVVGGAVTSVQRYGSSLNLHPHLHSLCLDGIYWREKGTDRVRFFEAPAPSKGALAEVARRVARRVNRLLVRQGLLVEGSREEGGAIAAEPADPSLLDVLQGASIQGLVGLGSRWKRVESPGRLKGVPAVSLGEKPFGAEVEGYSLHAGVELDGRDREKLEKVCRYILRPAFAEERLRERGDGRIEYELRKPRWDGATSIVLEPLELLEKLAALVPPPRAHLLRYHGVLGPSHEWRRLVVPEGPPADEEACDRGDEIKPWDGEDAGEERWGGRGRRRRKRRKDQDWATRIRRSLGLDALRCPSCGGRMKVIATIVEPSTVRRILRSMGLPAEIPARAPPLDATDEAV